jgi:hypothetical protein
LTVLPESSAVILVLTQSSVLAHQSLCKISENKSRAVSKLLKSYQIASEFMLSQELSSSSFEQTRKASQKLIK